MSRLFLETEHQELFVLDADLRAPIPVHIPSALARLGYYVCLRVPAELAGQLAAVRVRAQIGGLQPDDVELGAGDGRGEAPAILPSRRPGQAWAVLCRAFLSRGEGTLTFSGQPAALRRADLLLCTWLRFLASGQADEWIACQADPAWAPGGVPLGGIGTGKVELCRDGRFRNFSGNNNQDMPLEDPDGLPGAALSIAADGCERVLATRPAGGIPPVPALVAAPRFPRITLHAPQALPGLDVAVAATGPLVPHDLRLSCLPGFLLRWTARNRRREPLRVTCRLAWPNLVGEGGGLAAEESRTGYGDGVYRYWSAPAGHRVVRVEGPGYAGLRYDNAPNPIAAAADGHHYVVVATAMPDSPTPARVHVVPDLEARTGSVAATVALEAGECLEIDMAVLWEMPRWTDSQGSERGLFWQSFCRDGGELLAVLLANRERIWAAGGALGELLARTDLPEWLQARLQNCCYPLVTNSVLLRDGRFSVNEGPTEMAGCYGTLDQRLAAHAATLLFFPELNRRELAQFAACQAPSGGVNHDLGGGHLERGASEQSWPDLTCAFVLQLARHAWLLGDHGFAAACWPQARAALLRHAAWASQGGGVAQVGRDGLGTSYDGYHYEGTTPYMATLWIATLQVARAWARQAHDADTAALTERLEQAALARLEADLWNGRYYRTYASPDGPQNDRCHAGMLAGEFYARTLAGTSTVPAARLPACIDAVLALNGSERFAVPPDEAAADLSSWTEYGWLPYVESFGLCAAALHGDARVLAVWERMVAAMDGGGRHPCDTRLMYQPLSGAPSWGAYYMTAPASWLVYEALLDCVYLPAEGVLRLQPRLLRGAFAVIHPLFWARGRRDGCRVSVRVERVFATAPLAVRELEAEAAAGRPWCDGQPLHRTGLRGTYARYALPDAVPVAPGVELRWEMRPEERPVPAP